VPIATTALDVAFVSAIAAALAAIAAAAGPLTTWLTARASRKHERDMRLFDERKLACVQLAREAERKRVVNLRIIDWLENYESGDRLNAPQYDEQTHLDTMSRVYGYVSEELLDVVSGFETPFFAFGKAVFAADLEDDDQRKELVQRAKELDASAGPALTAVRRALRNEIARTP
jgi:hypothetical protein